MLLLPSTLTAPVGSFPPNSASHGGFDTVNFRPTSKNRYSFVLQRQQKFELLNMIADIRDHVARWPTSRWDGHERAGSTFVPR